MACDIQQSAGFVSRDVGLFYSAAKTRSTQLKSLLEPATQIELAGLGRDVRGDRGLQLLLGVREKSLVARLVMDGYTSNNTKHEATGVGNIAWKQRKTWRKEVVENAWSLRGPPSLHRLKQQRAREHPRLSTAFRGNAKHRAQSPIHNNKNKPKPPPHYTERRRIP